MSDRRPDAAAIHARGLTKYFGLVVGIEELSFEVATGEIYGFLGANGAGKTTTIRLLLDLLRPSRGSAAILGIDCHRHSLRARRQVGYLPGDLPIYPDLSARDYLSYLCRLDGRPVSPAYLAHLLARFDVSDVDQRRRLRDQSHGMKQKIGIIQALMAKPPVVILDEPTAGLDPLMAQAFRETLADLKREGQTTVFLSSHVLTEVESSCDRIGLIRGGRMVASSSMHEIRRSAKRKVTVTFGDGGGAQVFEVAGPLGPLLASFDGRPLQDIEVEPFRLEDYIAEFYAGARR